MKLSTSVFGSTRMSISVDNRFGLESKSRSAKYIEKASADLAGIREISVEEAQELVYHYIHQVIDAFQNMDEILSEINHKNTQYQRAAINRAKFYLIGGEDVRGQLKEILSGMSEKIDAEHMDLGGIYRIPELRNEKLRRMMEKLAKVLNPEKIGGYVEEQLAGRRQMLASQLPFADTDDFVKMIYVRLYGQRKNMKYRISVLGEAEKNGYRFRDFEIIRKGR